MATHSSILAWSIEYKDRGNAWYFFYFPIFKIMHWYSVIFWRWPIFKNMFMMGSNKGQFLSFQDQILPCLESGVLFKCLLNHFWNYILFTKAFCFNKISQDCLLYVFSRILFQEALISFSKKWCIKNSDRDAHWYRIGYFFLGFFSTCGYMYVHIHIYVYACI